MLADDEEAKESKDVEMAAASKQDDKVTATGQTTLYFARI